MVWDPDCFDIFFIILTNSSVYPLSKAAQQTLRDLIVNAETGPSATYLQTTANSNPPLYSPIISLMRRARPWAWECVRGPIENAGPEHPKGSLSSVHTQIISKFKWSTFKSGFINTKAGAARRSRPLVILLHLSTEGRNQIKTLFTGFVEAALLFILTLFFAAQWGGNLYITAWALAFLLLFITAGRVVGILYVSYSAKVWGLHVVDCNVPEEISGCLRILCSMEKVLVTVNGANYFEGYRLDFLGKNFREWTLAYERGDFDDGEEEINHGSAQTVTEDLKYPSVHVNPVYSPSQDDSEGHFVSENGVSSSIVSRELDNASLAPSHAAKVRAGAEDEFNIVV
jgi:hypothetical protein